MKNKIKTLNLKYIWITILILFLSLNESKSQTTIFPDSWSTLDSVFSSQVINNFVYSAGYFTASSSNLYINKQGIKMTPFNPATYCSPGSSISINSADTTTSGNIVPGTSELLDLFSNTITDSAASLIECKFPIYSAGNTAYTWTMLIPVYNAGASGTLSLLAWDSVSTFTVDVFNGISPTITTNTVSLVSITVTQVSSTTVKVNGGNIAFIDTTTASFLWLQFSIGGTSDVTLSWFVITLNTNGSTTNTRDGGPICNSATNPCLETYTCVGTTCKVCHASCLTCSLDATNASANTACNTCNRHTSGWKTGPTSGSCVFSFVDISQYQDILVSTIEPPETNRVTLSFWTFIPDLSAFQATSNVVNFSVKNFLVVSLYGSSSSAVGVYCTAYQKLKPTVDTQVTVSSLQTVVTADLTTMINQVVPSSPLTSVSVNGKWFFTQCAMSFDHQQFYLNTSVDGIDNYTFKALPQEKLFTSPTSVSNDFYFKTVYRTGEYLNLKISNARNIGTKIYIKNLYIFREFIPYQLHYKHFDIHSIVTSAADWPELLYTLPFNSLTYGSSYSVSSTKYTLPSATTAITVTLTPNSIPNLTPPINFKRLDLSSVKNKAYSTTDLSSTSSITVGSNQFINFYNNKGLTCTAGFWLELTTYTCNANCINPSTYTMFPGVSLTKGYCNDPCSASMVCPNTGTQMQDLSNNFACTGAGISNVFYSCVSTALPNYANLYFNSFYTPANIYISSVSIPSYKSYIIEIWYLPDNTMVRSNFVTTAATNNANYIFYSNSMRVYIDATTMDYKLELQYNTGSPTVITASINAYEWNKLIFNVYWDTTNYNMQFFVNNSMTAVALTAPTSTNTNQTLSYILFCHLDVSNCNGNSIYWASGVYKSLRIWNGDIAQPYSVTQYYNLYSTFALTTRPASISYYYPMSLMYLANNVLTDPGNSANNFTVTQTWNNFNLQLYNYSSKMDYIQATNTFGKYMSSIATNSVTLGTCNAACKRCYGTSASNCYECNTGYFLTQNTCNSNAVGTYVFRSPSDAVSPADIVFNSFASNVTPMGTITFWVNVIGFATTNSDMIKYGANLKLSYDGGNYGTNANYGLNLINSSTYLAQEPLFRFNFGKWTFFSLAYYYNSSATSYFPAMMKFEINRTSYNILTSSINSFSISQFTICKDLYGLIASVKAYSNYIIGAYGFETNTASPPAPFSKPIPYKTYLTPGSNNSNCLNSGSDTSGWTDSYTCTIIYDKVFDTSVLCSVNTQYYNAGVCTTCPSGCSTMCMGNTLNANNALTSCTCTISNSNSSIILKNGSANICYKNDYVNFAKVSTITLTNVLTAKATQRYTLQFWVFAYNYVANTFGGLTFKWNYHNKVTITYSAGSYIFSCSPLYDASSTSFENSVSHSLAFTINTWNYVSCAVDQIAMAYYMSTAASTYTNTFGVATPANLLTNTVTTLVISDNSAGNEWGVLFFRQIRLWIDCYTSAGFLSRVKIMTPSLFPNLVNIWDPIYSGTNQMVDLTGSSPIAALSYTGTIGANVVDDTLYSTLFLCSESGQYFDSTTNACVQFTDLSQISDFSISNIACSYFGDYTMEFWIFVEDYTSVTNGVNIIWDKHVTVSIIKTTPLSAYCFPQGYYDDLSNSVGAAINTKFTNAQNAYSFSLTNSSVGWLWVRCAVSNYNKVYYVNSSGNQVLKSETLFGTVTNDYPLRYFFSNSQKSTLKVQNISQNTKKIYLRNIYLFKDFLPVNYDFRYTDLSNIGTNYFPSLVFATNFANYNPTTKKLSYSLYEYGLTSSIGLTITVTVVIGSTFALAANFVALPLCDPNASLKYDLASNSCVSITNCVKSTLNAWYCYDESSPLTCYNNNYFNLPATLGAAPTCTGQCPSGVIRTPGSAGTNAICNTACDSNILSCPSGSVGLLSALPTNFSCQTGFNRINYHCSAQVNTVNSITYSTTANSAIYFSRCYNTPSVYVNLSTTTTAKLLSGHIFEFWFKIDSVLDTCAMTTTSEYYLYAPPHMIYKNMANNNFYYQVAGHPELSGQLPSIQKYEWNRIMIKTPIVAGVQNVYVFVNYNLNTPECTVSNIPSITNMQMATISFCSNALNGNCLSSGPSAIEWGAAYYRNFRLWDVTSSTEWLVQAYNNNLFSEVLKSLVVFYPLTVDKIDINTLTNIVGNYDHIVYSINYSVGSKLYSADKPALVNYSTTFDWGVSNPGSFITSMSGTTITAGTCSAQCKRCFSSSSSSCYECNTGFVLKSQTCINVTNYYMKVPVTTAATPVALKITNGAIYDMTKATSFTMTFWVKFFGVNSSSTSSTPYIVSLSSNTMFAFDTSTKYLVFTQNSQTAFTSTQWNTYVGQWVLITFSNYISNTINTYYPNMMTLSVNNQDISMQTGYAIPSSGVAITQVALGYEVVALFAEFRFYSDFFQGAYGKVNALAINKASNLIFMISLSGNSPSNCISDSNLASGTVAALGVTCVGDYHIYFDGLKQCNDDTKYLDISLVSVDPPCGSCNAACTSLCFGSATNQCTCDLTQGYFWLRRDTITKQAYCDAVPYLDFSTYNAISFPNVKGSLTLESTLEFWVFIYSYNNSVNQFKQIDIAWNLHNKVSLFNQNNSLNAQCYVLNDITNPGRYTETINQTLTFYKWNLIRCGTDLRNKQFFFNSVLNTMQTVDIPTQPAVTTLNISMPVGERTNFGFVFLRELKLWQQFNYKYIDTSYINLTYTFYPGLLHYFKNTYSNTVTSMQDNVNVSVVQVLTRRTDFLGYNFVDPGNTALYSTLTLCNEGNVYNPTTLSCTTPTTTKCQIPGDLNDNCITCPTATTFISADTGACVATCPPKYFGNPKINQCRPCDSTCYQCTDIWPISCTACTGSLYFVPLLKQCVTTCEANGLTKSLTTPNMCVIFDASAVLVNASPIIPINSYNFTSLTAKVVGATSTGYTTNWMFNSTATIMFNYFNTSLVLNPAGPFTSDLTQLSVNLTPDFFQLGFTYNFILQIIKANGASSVTVSTNWNLTMNQAPQSGFIKVVPLIGLRNTTTFVMDCLNWRDENSVSLLYRFYSIENNTSTVNLITNWTSGYEAYTNFTVRYYQLPQTTVQVFCDAQDSMGAISTTSTNITIVNSLSSGIYTLTSAMSTYSLPSNANDYAVLARSQYLMSLGIPPYQNVNPARIRTAFEPALDGSVVTQVDPVCTSNFCFGNGYCDVVDISLACYCNLGYLGSNCHIDMNGYPTLASSYQNLYNAINTNIQNTLTNQQLSAMWNLYYAASTFIQDPSFFSSNLNTFITLAQTSFMDSVVSDPNKFLDLFEFYYAYTDMRMIQTLIKNKNATNYPGRDVKLTLAQQSDFASTYADISKGLNSLITSIIQKFGTSSQTIIYDSNFLYVAIAQLTPVFNETKFFADRITKYKSWVTFMKCINYIEITRLNNPYYVAWFAFVEYQTNPFSYDPLIYTNSTAPYVDLFFIDASTGKNIIVQGCDSITPITFYLPFRSYTWLARLNSQKSLYDPNNYKLPNDPIFSSPIYINDTGFVSNDTIADRIQLYHRQNNFSCQSYDSTAGGFSSTGVNFTNFTQNYISFNTSHLTAFSTFFVQNDVTYVVDGRFFYLKHPQIMLYSPNYWTNYAWFVIFALLVYYFGALMLLTCYDNTVFKQESLLDFLKKEIIKVHSPYEQQSDIDLNDLGGNDFNSNANPNGNTERPFDDYGSTKRGNQNPAREDYGGMEQPNGENPGDVLNLNNNNFDGDVKIGFDDDDEDNNRKSKKGNNFEPESIDIRTRKEDKFDDSFKGEDEKGEVDSKDEKGMNNFLSNADKNKNDVKFGNYIANFDLSAGDKDAADPMFMDKNEEEEHEKRLQAFANLNLGVCQFLCWNLKQRHVLLAPLIRVSVFNPRYKKLTLFVSECAIMMLLITIQLTNDPLCLVDFSTTPATINNLGSLVEYCFIAAIASDLILYVLVVFFRTSSEQRRRLYKIVSAGAQLLILKEWEEMSSTNMFYTIIGMLINLILILGSFYISISFVAVWKAFAWTWLLAFLICIVIDIILFEFLMEWFISILYWRRRSSQFLLRFAERMNRVRSYRTLWP